MRASRSDLQRNMSMSKLDINPNDKVVLLYILFSVPSTIDLGTRTVSRKPRASFSQSWLPLQSPREPNCCSIHCGRAGFLLITTGFLSYQDRAVKSSEQPGRREFGGMGESEGINQYKLAVKKQSQRCKVQRREYSP